MHREKKRENEPMDSLFSLGGYFFYWFAEFAAYLGPPKSGSLARCCTSKTGLRLPQYGAAFWCSSCAQSSEKFIRPRDTIPAPEMIRSDCWQELQCHASIASSTHLIMALKSQFGVAARSNFPRTLHCSAPPCTGQFAILGRKSGQAPTTSSKDT